MRRKEDQAIKNPAVVQCRTEDSEYTLRLNCCSTGKINMSRIFQNRRKHLTPLLARWPENIETVLMQSYEVLL